jgi:hypothetical protein
MVFTGVETGAGAADGVEVVGFAGSALGFCGVFGAFAGFHIFYVRSSQNVWIAFRGARSKSVLGVTASNKWHFAGQTAAAPQATGRSQCLCSRDVDFGVLNRDSETSNGVTEYVNVALAAAVLISAEVPKSFAHSRLTPRTFLARKSGQMTLAYGH